jgi:tRNA A-37 threonylcarbamoyl transferase component Bud32
VARLDGLWDELPSLAGARLWKQNRLRTVLGMARADLLAAPPGALARGGDVGERWVVKQYRCPALIDRLRVKLLGSRARREFRALERLRGLGFAAPRPIAWADPRDGCRSSAGGLVMEEVHDAERLFDRLARLFSPTCPAPAGGAPDPTARARRLLYEFGRLVRRLHDHGVLHPDLHAANVLVDAADGLHLIDLHSCRFLGWLPPPLRRRGLAKAAHALLLGIAAAELAWFLRGYLGDAAASFDDAAGPAGRTVEALSASLRRRAAALERRRLRSRTRRCLVDSTSFEVRRLGHRRIYKLRPLPLDFVQGMARVIPDGEVLKATERSWVARSTHGLATAIVKFRRLGLWESLASLISPHRLRRAWVAAHGLRVRRLPAPEALALVEERRWGCVRVAWLLVSEVAGGERLDEYLWRVYGEGRGRSALETRRKFAVARGLGRLWRALHEAGASLHDASPQNVLVVPARLDGGRDAGAALQPGASAGGIEDSPLWLVDIDDVRLRPRPIGLRRRLRNLTQAGNLPEGHVSAGDLWRALRSYDSGDGTYTHPGVVERLREGLMDEAYHSIHRLTRAEYEGRA